MSSGRWKSGLPDHRDWTVAVLVPENSRGFKVAEELKERGIEYEELLRSTAATRDAAGRLQAVFDYLAEPTSSRLLGRLYATWWDAVWDRQSLHPDEEQALIARDSVKRLLEKIKLTETFLWPGLEENSFASVTADLDSQDVSLLEDFREQSQALAPR